MITIERVDIIEKIGKEYLTSNVENGEFSYQKAFSGIGKKHTDFSIKNKGSTIHKIIDLRFTNKNLTVLVETKQRVDKGQIENHMKQLQQYVTYEKELTKNKVVAILASTNINEIHVWLDDTGIIDDKHEAKGERVIRPFDEYINIFLAQRMINLL